jgi:hypothetical protein
MGKMQKSSFLSTNPRKITAESRDTGSNSLLLK